MSEKEWDRRFAEAILNCEDGFDGVYETLMEEYENEHK